MRVPTSAMNEENLKGHVELCNGRSDTSYRDKFKLQNIEKGLLLRVKYFYYV